MSQRFTMGLTKSGRYTVTDTKTGRCVSVHYRKAQAEREVDRLNAKLEVQS